MINLFDYPLELDEAAQRHRRNLIIASTVIGFIAATPEMSLSDLKVFGMSLSGASDRWVWGGAIAFIIYFLITFIVDVRLCWAKWEVKTYKLFGGHLKVLFGDTLKLPSTEKRTKGDVLVTMLDCDVEKATFNGASDVSPEDKLAELQKLPSKDNSFILRLLKYEIENPNKTEICLQCYVEGYTPKGQTELDSFLYPSKTIRKYKAHIRSFQLLQVGLPILMGLAAITLCIIEILWPSTSAIARPTF